MTDPTLEHTDDAGLFAALRRMWRAKDPMPDGLIDEVLVTLATRELADDYALLVLVDDSSEMVGTRGPGGVRVLEFGHGATTAMLRVSELDDGRVRIDGWLVPAGTSIVHLEQDAADESSPVSAEGRFEFAAVARGATRLRIVPDSDSTASSAPSAFGTEQFDL